MSYVLYGEFGSGSSIIECALAELGVACVTRNVDLGENEQRGAGYRSVNPQRKLPTLVTPDGETVTESTAILLTLDERHGGTLWPAAGTPDRAQALRWMMFMATEVYPLVEILDYPERFTPDGTPPGEVRRKTLEHWRARLTLVDAALAGDPWLLASGFCITDVYIAVVSRWGRQQRWRPDNVPNLERLAAAIADRPSLADIWNTHFGAR